MKKEKYFEAFREKKMSTKEYAIFFEKQEPSKIIEALEIINNLKAKSLKDLDEEAHRYLAQYIALKLQRDYHLRKRRKFVKRK